MTQPITRDISFGPRFTALAGTINFGQDPATLSSPPTNRKHVSYGYQNVQTGERFIVGTVDNQSVQSANTASFRVNNNTFGSFSAIQIGSKFIRYGIDWIEGASTTLTAANIASAINNLGGPWSATNGGTNTVTISFSKTLLNVCFSPKNFTTVENFDQISPNTGFMLKGSPSIVAPIIQ